jgi:hypothetical protein
MKLTRMRAAIAVAVAVAGTAAVPASAGTTAAASAPKVVLVQCNGHGSVKPSGSQEPFCMPSSQYFAALKWVSWRSVAYGSGTLKVNSCNPSCAAGKYIKYPVLTVLWRAEPWSGHHGKDYFSRITYIFSGKRPHGTAVAHTSVLPSKAA